MTRASKHLTRVRRRLTAGQGVPVDVQILRRALRAEQTRRARLESELRQAERLATTLDRVTTQVRAAADPGEVMPDLLADSARVLGATVAGIARQEDDRWGWCYTWGVPQKDRDRQLAGAEARLAATAAAGHAPVFTAEVAAPGADGRGAPAEQGWAWLAAPLVLHDRVTAVLLLGGNGGSAGYGRAETDFVAKLAALLSLTLENARLHQTELRQTQAALQGALSERRRMEGELREQATNLRLSEARFKAVFEQAGLGIALLDLQGRVLETNPAMTQMLGYTAEELRFMRFIEYTHPSDIERDLHLYQELLEGKRDAYRVEKRFVRKDGLLLWGSLTTTALRSPTGGLLFTIGMVKDITERKLAERALRQNTEHLRMLEEIDRAILAAKSPAEIAHAVARRIRQLVPCDRAAVSLFDADGERAQWLATDGIGDDALSTDGWMPLTSFRKFPEHAAGQVGVVTNLALLPELASIEQKLVQAGLASYASVPLLATNEQPGAEGGTGNATLIGALNLWRSVPGTFTPDELKFARQVADSLAVAIHQARLFEEVTASRQQLQELSRRVVATQENERRAIARELHDQTGQSMTALLMGLGVLERELADSSVPASRVSDLKRMAGEIMEDLHRLAVDLRPASLDRLGLVPALQQYVETYRRQTGLEVELITAGLDERRWPPDVETALYRVVQEALTNVARHAHARRVGIVIERRAGPVQGGRSSGDRALAIIEDDGAGFDPDQARKAGRLGLYGMQERAEILGGSLAIESAPGRGTTVYVDVPASPEGVPAP